MKPCFGHISKDFVLCELLLLCTYLRLQLCNENILSKDAFLTTPNTRDLLPSYLCTGIEFSQKP